MVRLLQEKTYWKSSLIDFCFLYASLSSFSCASYIVIFYCKPVRALMFIICLYVPTIYGLYFCCRHIVVTRNFSFRYGNKVDEKSLIVLQSLTGKGWRHLITIWQFSRESNSFSCVFALKWILGLFNFVMVKINICCLNRATSSTTLRK